MRYRCSYLNCLQAPCFICSCTNPSTICCESHCGTHYLNFPNAIHDLKSEFFSINEYSRKIINQNLSELRTEIRKIQNKLCDDYNTMIRIITDSLELLLNAL